MPGGSMISSKKTYPDTIESFQAAIFVAQHYQRARQLDEMQTVLDAAIAHFQKIAADGKNAGLEAAAQEFTAIAYIMQGKLDAAVRAFEVLRTKYHDDPRAELALVQIALLYQKGLKDIPRAREAYLRFAQEHPKNRLTPMVRDILEKLPPS